MKIRLLISFGVIIILLFSCTKSISSEEDLDEGIQSTNSPDSSNYVTGAKLIDSFQDLPDCNNSSLGQLFYLLDEEEFNVCTKEGYIKIDLNGEAGENGTDGISCDAYKRNDSLFINCNGTLDTLFNGQDGANGTDGTSCDAHQQNDSLFINCNGVLDTITNGKKGEQGDSGSSCDVIDNGNSTYSIICENGNTVTISDGAKGDEGQSGVSIEWLGGLDKKPIAPKINQAFYWNNGGMSCIWNGSSWDILSLDAGIPATTCENKFTSTEFIDSRDDQLYKWVKIGKQIWMAENLKYLPSVNPLSDGLEDDSIGSITSHYYVYDYDGTDVQIAKSTLNFNSYGVLYDFNAVKNINDPSCPAGWHVPDSTEWQQLSRYIDKQQDSAGITDHTTYGWWNSVGKYFKSSSGWNSSTQGLDTYGFSAKPSGSRIVSNDSSSFRYLTNFGTWWSKTPTSNNYIGWYCKLYASGDEFSWHNAAQSLGQSIRCIQDNR